MCVYVPQQIMVQKGGNISHPYAGVSNSGASRRGVSEFSPRCDRFGRPAICGQSPCARIGGRARGIAFRATPRRRASHQCRRPILARGVTLRQSHSTPQLARRDVDQHEVHGPAAKPVLGLRRCPGRQRKLMVVIATHQRATDRNAAVKADLAFGSAPRCPARSPPRLCGLPASSWASSHSICSIASIPAVRQKRFAGYGAASALQRPRGRRAAENRDEMAPFQLIDMHEDRTPTGL